MTLNKAEFKAEGLDALRIYLLAQPYLDRDPVLGKWFLTIAPTRRAHANVAPG